MEVLVREIDKVGAVKVAKMVVAYHPIGIICNILCSWVVLGSLGAALFKGKVLSALVVIALCLVLRLVIMRVLAFYLARKLRQD
jgi:hypothetical protein